MPGKHLPGVYLFVGTVLLAVSFMRINAESPLTIAIAGDSTVATSPDGSTHHGWGQYIQGYFRSSVVVINLAKDGCSTKTFIEEGIWQQTLNAHARYILIQFGHNDSHTPDHPEHTDADGDYAKNLARMVDDARAANAIPILVTPVQRRTAVDGLIRYADSMKRVAVEKKVALIDLHELSGRYYQTLTPEQVEKLQAPDDKTHFSATGAQDIAAIVMHELAIALPDLQTQLNGRSDK